MIAGRRTIGRVFAAIAIVTAGATAQSTRPLPDRLSDAQFWGLMTSGSAPGGYFPSDNFTSNELLFPRVVAALRKNGVTGGAYIGVGAEQNFNYVAAIRPAVAFIVDIRRQSVIQHLMYKAIFELSADRADFVSLLFAKPRPPGLDTASTAQALMDAYWMVRTDTSAFAPNLARITNHLVRTHGFALSADDLASLRYVYEAFYRIGPSIGYGGYAAAATPGPAVTTRTTMTSASGSTYTVVRLSSADAVASVGLVPRAQWLGRGGERLDPPLVAGRVDERVASVGRWYDGVNFASLAASVDDDSVPRSFLANEAAYRTMRDLHQRNLFIPLVDDFAGPTGIRAAAQFLRDHGTPLAAFYMSNVEDYLVRPGKCPPFAANFRSLPLTPNTVIIRSNGGCEL
jgi:hypothetical protein